MRRELTREELMIAERLVNKVAAGQPKPMQRRVFLKLSGLGGLALGWACSSDGAGTTATPPAQPLGMAGGPGGMGPDPEGIATPGSTSPCRRSRLRRRRSSTR